MSSLTTNCSESISSINESMSMRTWILCMPMSWERRIVKYGRRETAQSMNRPIWRSVR